jgi:hypothetical protein
MRGNGTGQARQGIRVSAVLAELGAAQRLGRKI